ncbi:hypothetical protein LZ32DRAFT_114274 [Colletotrichum eremochloae]|nr:hypothetical protein LZ32DRAFT_114274 [Colletotrichum eremochloae]
MPLVRASLINVAHLPLHPLLGAVSHGQIDHCLNECMLGIRANAYQSNSSTIPDRASRAGIEEAISAPIPAVYLS